MSNGAIQKPDRLTLGKLDTGDLLEVQYNPETLKESLEPLYNRLQIVGMSHELLQYGGTKNFSVEFDLKFDAVAQGSAGGINVPTIGSGAAAYYDIDAARKFLLGMGYARRSATSQLLSNGQPTNVIVIWPFLYTLTTKMTAYSGDLTTFAANGRLLRWTAHLKFEEIRDMRLWADDVEVQGTIRPANTSAEKAAINNSNI